MKSIGLIDDKNTQRIRFGRKLSLSIEKYNDWRVIDSKPFASFPEYNSWINENDVSVLILDERLNEESLNDGSNVDYFGHDLVKYLRGTFKTLPIFSVTNYDRTDELNNALQFFNHIVSRRAFDDDLDNYVNLLVMSGEDYFQKNQGNFNKLSQLSEKIAKGDANDDDLKQARILQSQLALPHISDSLINRDEYLSGLEDKIKEMEQITRSIQDYLSKKK